MYSKEYICVRLNVCLCVCECVWLIGLLVMDDEMISINKVNGFSLDRTNIVQCLMMMKDDTKPKEAKEEEL